MVVQNLRHARDVVEDTRSPVSGLYFSRAQAAKKKMGFST
jgi:hypothetical protein